MKKKINYIIMLALIALTFWILLRSIKLSNLVYFFHHTNKVYIVLGCVMMVIFWAADAWILKELTGNVLGSDYHFNVFNLAMIGQYYAMITPFAGGAQPAQLYYMGKRGEALGKSTVILLNKYVVYEAVVTIYSFILYVIHVNAFADMPGRVIPFINIGFLVHVFGVLGIIILIYSPKIVEAVVKFFLELGRKIRLIHNIDDKLGKFQKFIDEYRNGLSLIINNKLLLIKIAFITLIQLTALFAVSYFVSRSLYINKGSIVEMVSLQAILYIAVSFIPTPGTLGASEAGYYTLYSGFFPGTQLLAYSLLLWRGITFYLNLIVSGAFTLIFYFRDKSH
jgi:uncharacterized protein (TIRG00374 family)